MSSSVSNNINSMQEKRNSPERPATLVVSRKRLRDTAKPLVITAAYEVVSKVTGSNALAFGLVGGVYVLAKNSKQYRRQRSSPSEEEEEDLFCRTSIAVASSSEAEDSPVPKKRRMRKRDSILQMIDLLNPISSFAKVSGNSSSKSAKGSTRKRIRSFPLHVSKSLWKLSTAPVEEKLSESDNENEDLVRETKEPSVQPNGLWQECDQCHEVSSSDVEVSPLPSDAEEEEIARKPAANIPSEINSNVGLEIDEPERSGETKSSDSYSSNSSLQPTMEGASIPIPVETKVPEHALRNRRRSSSMNINPAAAFGVAGELCRKQMDDDQQEHAPSTRASRRRFLSSLYAHAGIPTSNGDTNPLSTPLVLATNFNVRSSGAWSDGDHFYSRISNPTRDALEQVLAAAERTGKDECRAACFASGMATVAAVIGAASSIMISSKKGVHIVLPKTCYDESFKMIQMGSEGITSFIRVDMLDLDQVDAALGKHPESGKVLFLETPDNPLVSVCNLQELVKIARRHEAIVIVDTTWSPPLVCQTFRYGVDAICFSCTKTMGGHSDALLGAVVTNGSTPLGKAVFPRVKDIQITMGGVASPFDSWLILRGLRTMPVRMERMCNTSMKLATFLENHPLAEWVRYPGLASHPQHLLAKTQMDLFGQMVTWCIVGGSEAAMAFVGAVSLARRATSTGGTETLVQHQRSVEMKKVTPGGIIRVSVGLEHPDDVIEDFDKALKCVAKVLRSLQSSSCSSTNTTASGPKIVLPPRTCSSSSNNNKNKNNMKG